MTRKSGVFYSLLVIVSVVLTGCIRYYDAVRSEFPQAKEYEYDSKMMASCRRSVLLYDQFRTVATFDAVWLSDQVRISYSNLYSAKRGYSIDQKEALLRRQLEENKHWVSMYVLSDIRDKSAPSLGEENASWTMFAKLTYKQQSEKETTTVVLYPESIKEVDLQPEHRALFGLAYNNFKTAYMVKFAVDQATADAISERFVALDLCIRSVKLEAVMTWNSNDVYANQTSNSCVNHEDFYWG